MVRDRRPEGDDVGTGIIGRSWACAPRNGPTCCCTTTWARSTAHSARGGCRAAAPVRSQSRSRALRAKPVSRFAPRRRCRASSSRKERRSGWARQRRLLHGNVVASSLDPRANVSRNSWARNICPADFVEDVKRYNTRGSSGKVNLALDALFRISRPCRAPVRTCAGPCRISPGVDYMERAYDEAQIRRYSRKRHRHGHSEF